MLAILQNKKRLSFILALLLCFSGFIYFLTTGWDPVTYTRSDWVRFTFFTNKLVKNLPELDDKTQITFRPQDGPPTTEGYWVDCKKHVDTRKLENYLERSGYKKKTINDYGQSAEAWVIAEQSNPYHSISLYAEKNGNTKIVFIGMQ